MIIKKNNKGYGVYATRDYKKSEKICVMRGRKVRPRTLEYHGGDFRKASSNPLQIGPDWPAAAGASLLCGQRRVAEIYHEKICRLKR